MTLLEVEPHLVDRGYFVAMSPLFASDPFTRKRSEQIRTRTADRSNWRTTNGRM